MKKKTKKAGLLLKKSSLRLFLVIFLILFSSFRVNSEEPYTFHGLNHSFCLQHFEIGFGINFYGRTTIVKIKSLKRLNFELKKFKEDVKEKCEVYLVNIFYGRGSYISKSKLVKDKVWKKRLKNVKIKIEKSGLSCNVSSTSVDYFLNDNENEGVVIQLLKFKSNEDKDKYIKIVKFWDKKSLENSKQ
jgi:hypothetical protein